MSAASMSNLVIRIKGSERYFHGCCDDGNKPVFGEYNDGMKIYRDSKKWTAERRARQAIEVIGMNGCDLFRDLEIVAADRPIPPEIKPDKVVLPEVPAPPVPKAPTKPALVPVPENEYGGWEVLDGIGNSPPKMCRREWNGCCEYAIFMPDHKLYFLPRDELEAWSRYCDECKEFICRRISERRGAKGSSPPDLSV